MTHSLVTGAVATVRSDCTWLDSANMPLLTYNIQYVEEVRGRKHYG